MFYTSSGDLRGETKRDQYGGEMPETKQSIREKAYAEANQPKSRESSQDHFLADNNRYLPDISSRSPNTSNNTEEKETEEPKKASTRRGSVVNPWTAAASSLQTQRVGTGNEEAAQEYKSSYLNKLLNFFR